MRSFILVRALITMVFAAGLTACGGDDGGGGLPVDAPTAIDAPTGVDAPVGGALGQICNQAMPCPASAPQCLVFAQGANGFCSLTCATGEMHMPNAQHQFPAPPATTNAVCVAQAQAGQPGTQVCGVVLSNTLQPPVPAGQQNNPATTYTYDAACIVLCGTGNTCPTGLTCNAGACIP